ncbi:hypothetical protein [Streptomyces sp. Amel2xC10]|uniref:hypothetical protein n=1 Tax=Streptomyces sp. Amel2xC10 TaxID=1305826 RepID=UPI000A16395A|nr:hypothetical protein [Streptomyces sp. Amel2xC10]
MRRAAAWATAEVYQTVVVDGVLPTVGGGVEGGLVVRVGATVVGGTGTVGTGAVVVGRGTSVAVAEADRVSVGRVVTGGFDGLGGFGGCVVFGGRTDAAGGLTGVDVVRGAAEGRVEGGFGVVAPAVARSLGRAVGRPVVAVPVGVPEGRDSVGLGRAVLDVSGPAVADGGG